MSFQEFIRLEAKAFGILQSIGPQIVWKAIECGAAEKMRLYAESRGYNVTVDQMVKIALKELCISMDDNGTLH
ncbi:MAG: hypothetical protein A2219_01025 [Elusimicrobia bacterium RIFOXYA2_FULL_50_26]|nr:MAG: hypothetical protein A2219_01025 [Elusimicrobia bacterium RIFOXYA2_FULL_50_26]OGS22712.1 MAG: hypothetical protein A2314_08605 [Elusimicrobia bacterium RIFOXYB2_FULL_50_12]